MQKQQDSQNSEQVDERSWVITIGTRLVTRQIVLGIVLLIILGICVAAISYTSFFPASPSLATDLMRGVGIGLVIVAITSGFVAFLITSSPKEFQNRLNTFIEEDVTRELEKLGDDTIKELTELQADVGKQTKELVGISQSLMALNQISISRVYVKRSDASDDMIHDLQDENLSEIRIIGISLNDFVPEEKTELHRVWKVIEEYIDASLTKWRTPRDPPLDIKVLIIDPNCLGAHLRSVGENRKSVIRESRLADDVYSTAKPLLKLQRAAARNYDKTRVKFQFRFYQLPPQMFLLHTNKVSYIEPYYFWASRSTTASMPVFKFTLQSRVDSQLTPQFHGGMADHFDLVWEKASISPEQFDQHYVGIEKGMRQCGAANVFSDPLKARKRMLWHLKNAKERVYIQGISLHSFFDEGQKQDNLYAEIRNLVARDVEVKILLLDPDSEQAAYRAFRERLLKRPLPPVIFDKYQNDKQERRKDRLYRETKESIEQIHRIAKPGSKLQVMLYNAAPTCFMLLVDNTVLVEQYQYGKILGSDEANSSDSTLGSVNPILGTDMPLVEYVEYERIHDPDSLFESNPDRSSFTSLEDRNSFRLMENHFNFVFKECAYPVERLLDEV